MNATEICKTVKESLSNDVSVYFTDGTETRKVVDIYHHTHTYNESYLDITVENGEGKRESRFIRTIWALLYEADGYDIVNLNGDMFIAPDWWIAI